MMYNEGLKRTMVEKLLSPDSIGITALSRETGIPRRTLFDWREKYCSESEIVLKVSRSPKDWPFSAKLEAIFESTKIEKEDFGAWLRSRGLQSEHIEKWKDEIRTMAKNKKKDDLSKKEEIRELKVKNKELERELRRKDKALAEASALLLLKKKFDALMEEKENSSKKKREKK